MDYLKWLVLAMAAFIIFSGCVTPSPPVSSGNNNSNTNSNPPVGEDIQQIIDDLPTPEPGPGDPLQACGTEADAEECFEDALKECGRATASFWSTSDGQKLDFELSGLDVQSLAQGREWCKVRVYVDADSESSFAGTSAVCLLEKNASGIYEVYDIGPDACTGTYVDEINRTAALPSADGTPNSITSPPTQTQPPSAVRTITLTASDSGFRDASNTPVTQVQVQNGEKIKFTFISSTSNNSFGGQGIKTTGLNLFSFPNIAPGAQQTTEELTVTQGFVVQTWWPNFQVKKGEFQVVVQ